MTLASVKPAMPGPDDVAANDADAARPAPPAAHDALGAYPRVLVEASLEKLLASPVFRRSERHRRFMRYIVHETLDGRRDRLKEVLLGIALFDRSIDRYDPRSDPIVRVEAGRLRDKLARHYAREGAEDPFVFCIPVGSYVPRFDRREQAYLPPPRIEAFAVMPFAHGGDDDRAFTIGLADQLINLLGRVRDLKVVAPVSAFKARERNLQVREIGKLLQVTRVIDGSVQRQGRRLRCIAHIYDAASADRLWSQDFDSAAFMRRDDDGEPAVDLFAFQDHIAEAVLAAASPAVDSPVGRPGRAGAQTTAMVDGRRARDLVEQATYLLRRYDATNTGKVIAMFEEAVALDPGNIQGHIGLGDAYFYHLSLLNAPTGTWLARMEAVADRALALDPMHGDALSLRASIAARFEFDWPKARRLFQTALRIAPHAISVNYRYASGLVFDGRFDEAFRHLDLAIELDPLNLGLRASAVHMLAYSRDYARAEHEAQVILEEEPGQLYVRVVLGLVHLYRGRPEAASTQFDLVIAAFPEHPVAHLGLVCAWGVGGDVERGRRALDALQVRFADRHCSSYWIAMARSCLGDRTATFDALERAARGRDPLFSSLPVDPLFDRWHGDAPFVDLLARHGLRSPST